MRTSLVPGSRSEPVWRGVSRRPRSPGRRRPPGPPGHVTSVTLTVTTPVVFRGICWPVSPVVALEGATCRPTRRSRSRKGLERPGQFIWSDWKTETVDVASRSAEPPGPIHGPRAYASISDKSFDGWAKSARAKPWPDVRHARIPPTRREDHGARRPSSSSFSTPGRLVPRAGARALRRTPSGLRLLRDGLGRPLRGLGVAEITAVDFRNDASSGRRAGCPSGCSARGCPASGMPSRCFTSARRLLPCAATITCSPRARRGTIASYQYGRKRSTTSARLSVAGRISGGGP